jgi:T-complex protein 1 subunit zeta
VNNALDDGYVVPGAGAFEAATHLAIRKGLDAIKGKERLGLQAYADAMLVIPKTLAQNAGYDSQDVIVKLLAEAAASNQAVGMDCSTGEAVNPLDIGVIDNYCVKRQMINSCTVIASNLLLVDEIMRAGLSSLKGN